MNRQEERSLEPHEQQHVIDQPRLIRDPGLPDPIWRSRVASPEGTLWLRCSKTWLRVTVSSVGNRNPDIALSGWPSAIWRSFARIVIGCFIAKHQRGRSKTEVDAHRAGAQAAAHPMAACRTWYNFARVTSSGTSIRRQTVGATSFSSMRT